MDFIFKIFFLALLMAGEASPLSVDGVGIGRDVPGVCMVGPGSDALVTKNI